MAGKLNPTLNVFMVDAPEFYFLPHGEKIPDTIPLDTADHPYWSTHGEDADLAQEAYYDKNNHIMVAMREFCNLIAMDWLPDSYELDMLGTSDELCRDFDLEIIKKDDGFTIICLRDMLVAITPENCPWEYEEDMMEGFIIEALKDHDITFMPFVDHVSFPS